MGCNLVCRVKVRGEIPRPAVEFVWSEGSASFPPIVLDPEQTATFSENARDARHKLFGMVSLHVPRTRARRQGDPAGVFRPRDGRAVPLQPASARARPGRAPTSGSGSRTSRGPARSTASRLSATASPGSPPGTSSTTKIRMTAGSRTAGAGLDEQFGPFWGIRHTLCGSLPVSPLRRNPLPASLDTLLIIDPVVSRGTSNPR